MVFTTWLYGLFLIVAAVIYWILPKSRRDYFLLAASGIFLAYHLPRHVLLLLAVSTLVYLAGNYLQGRRLLLSLGVIIPLAVLAYYKYQGLWADFLQKLSAWQPGLPVFKVPELVIPLGISYFTFKLIHYLVDSYRGTRPRGSYGQFLLYIFFFPILSSGPIERWPNFLAQNREFGDFRWGYLTEGGQRILTGLFKKLVLADTAAIYAEKLPTIGHSSAVYWIAAYAYALQIYFDFAGYSDIAIGSARFFGYRIMENFNNPYLKRNLSLFWKNWHISLTGWLRDYVFIPLGGSRVPFGRLVLNTFIVMGLVGLWHGAALHYVVWGLFHAAGLIVLRLYGRFVLPRLPGSWHGSRLPAAVGTLLTFHFVVLGWVFFATDFGQSIYVIKKLFLLG